MAKPSNYWDKRALRRLTEAEKQGEAYSKRIQKIYDQAHKNIQRDIENIYANYSKATGMDVQSLKEILTKTQTQKLWEELKAKGLDQYVKGNYKARITRLEQLQAQLYAKVKEIYILEQETHTACFSDVLNDSYYKAIYDTQMGTGYDFAFSNLDDNLVEAVLSERWSGKNYSQRIWGNTDILAHSVSEIVGGALLSGQSYAKTSRQIRERFNVGKYYADRLVRTECNHFHNQADAMAYEEMDVDKYVFIAVLDNRTSEICQKYDNKVIDLKDKQEGVNFPPLHPNCRSTTRAYMGEEIEKTLKRRARNPITGENEVIDNISYREWAEKHGLNRELTNNVNSIKMDLNRKTTNTGLFSTLPERMSKKHIRYVAEKYGIDLKGITLNIDYNVELLRTPFSGRADPEKIGSITFFPNAFKSREELVRTIYHEIEHTKQYKMYGVKFVQSNRSYFEDLAYKAENEFIDNLKRKGITL